MAPTMFNPNRNWILCRQLLLLCVYLCCVRANSAIASTQYIFIPDAMSHDHIDLNYYPEELLKLVLQKTDATYGRTEIKFYPLIIGRNRARAVLMNKLGLDVIWSSSTHQREEQLLAIKFNLFKGINEYKILLIRNEDQEKFAKVQTLADLRHFKAGTGTHWQDTQVLTFNNIPFVTSWNYEPLFKMLAAKRFDYMVRGSQEISSELVLHPTLPLMAEQTLLLHYKQPLYYFVHKDNTILAERILRGLNLAQADGSLDALLESVPGYIALDELHSKQRRVFELADPE